MAETLKLSLLNYQYQKVSSLTSKFNSHLEILNKHFLIDYNELINYQNTLYEIVKKINKYYNDYLIQFDDINNINDINTSDFIDCDTLILEEIKHIHNEPSILNDLPLEKLNYNLNQLILRLGYPSLKEGLDHAFHKTKANILKEKHSSIIEELEDIFIPLKFTILNKKINNYCFNINKPYLNDTLNITCILELSLDANTCVSICGFFPKNNLNLEIKTCQINRKLLFSIKKNLLDYCSSETSIPTDFIKSYLRNINLKFIYHNNKIEFKNKIESDYHDFLFLSNSTFINIYNKFINKKTSIKEMYKIIFLLLLGDEDIEDMASLLYSLIKEKKIGHSQISKIIYQNLSFHQQIKLKRSNYNIKEELEKIQSLNFEEVDYKKQIVVNKNIPSNVKSLMFEKVEEMKTGSNDYYKQLTFVKNLLKFPWPSSNDNSFFDNLTLDNTKAFKYMQEIEQKLYTLSFGHEEAKRSLLQLVGKWISNPQSSGSSIGLVGPPGVGKTLLAKSISEALNIPFAQITLGGQNDGELLHGHGYAYTGSQPGMIIKKMIETGSQRCILYFDELDKATNKNGKINEISSILIHLTDTNMNSTFQDRFFQGVDFPLNKVIFIFSYNDSELIDPILLDRIKEINVKPYTVSDKIQIVQDYILPEIKKHVGMDKIKIEFEDELVEELIELYTNEAGVRGIKQLFENLLLNLNLDKIYKRNLFKRNRKTIKIKKSDIEKYLDKPSLENLEIHSVPEIGIINGLYATSTGTGGIIPIQIFKNYSVDEEFEIKLTGKQGDVMKESVHCSFTAAMNYLSNNLDKFPLIENLDSYVKGLFKTGFHVHAPSTSTPKDGPSAGCAFTSAFISRITGRKIKNNVGMTGEIELTGRITKIGGLLYKLQGAKKAGIKLVFIPKENETTLKEIKIKNHKLIDKNFQVKPVDNISEIIPEILL
ncbi:putative Lon protease [Cafeteria roenbergensis virus]|uniref:Putative Lon protease n=1 Tax=Cafeteria roenbergensis virus (strain BV-PW1) TaxID=693272 RepID=E3T507_CROVB|nr:putative Lon protease [Cafeteria roenbergensis virus BV-PW1]ADO67270.1 putative Lon protease [Cafeteria roenbergensis virus BV-PW1]